MGESFNTKLPLNISNPTPNKAMTEPIISIFPAFSCCRVSGKARCGGEQGSGADDKSHVGGLRKAQRRVFSQGNTANPLSVRLPRKSSSSFHR